MNSYKKIALVAIFLFSSFAAWGGESKEEGSSLKLLDLPKSFKESSFKIWPIPVFETDPAAGQRYGLMPTLLWMDKEDRLIGIAVAALTYNPKVVKLGTFGGIFLYPSDKERLRLFVELAQNFTKDYYVQYANESWLKEKFDFEIELDYIVDPFERFYGFGPDTSQSNESNFVSKLMFGKGRTAYEFFPKIKLQLEERWERFRIRTRALNTVNDTITSFAGLREVSSFNQLSHRISGIWDTRDSNDFPTLGNYVEPYFLLSHKGFGKNRFFYGYGLVNKKIFTLGERFTTLIGLRLDQVFGDFVPFYLQPYLGGDRFLRGFVWRRFVGRGRFLFDVEERILVKRWNVMDVKFDLSIDPFFSLGQVFDRWSQVGFDNLQPVGGIGFRAKAPPSIVGRIDVGIGKEGLEVFMTLDYPF